MTPVQQAALRRAVGLVVDEAADLVRRRDDDGCLLPPGGLPVVTVAPDLESEPALARHAALLLGPAYRLRWRADGVHRRCTTGGVLPTTALVLERGAA